MRYIILFLLLALPVQVSATDLVIRTKAGVTIKQAAVELKQFIKKHNMFDDGSPLGNIEDLIGDVMTPPVKSTVTTPINRWYVRIRITDPTDIAAVTLALPNATTVQYVCVDCEYELDPGVWVGGIL